jgi:hypothetical protein
MLLLWGQSRIPGSFEQRIEGIGHAPVADPNAETVGHALHEQPIRNGLYRADLSPATGFFKELAKRFASGASAGQHMAITGSEAFGALMGPPNR